MVKSGSKTLVYKKKDATDADETAKPESAQASENNQDDEEAYGNSSDDEDSELLRQVAETQKRDRELEQLQEQIRKEKEERFLKQE